MDTVVFLDIDGVLNTKESWRTPFQLDDGCIRNFCRCLSDSKRKVRIVLTSSWKNGFSSIPEYETSQLQELRKKLGAYGFSISGRTRDLANRMAEIDDYLTGHEVAEYAVVDDDRQEYSPEYLKKVTLIDSAVGFTLRDGKRILWNLASSFAWRTPRNSRRHR